MGSRAYPRPYVIPAEFLVCSRVVEVEGFEVLSESSLSSVKTRPAW